MRARVRNHRTHTHTHAPAARRLYLAYTVFWAVGGLLAMQVRFIGSNHITSHELLAFNMVWLGLQVRQGARVCAAALCGGTAAVAQLCPWLASPPPPHRHTHTPPPPHTLSRSLCSSPLAHNHTGVGGAAVAACAHHHAAV
jgi:hypothetical protein